MAKPFSIEVKVSGEQRETLRRKAEALGMSVSGYLRFVGLGSKIEIKN